MNQVILYYIYRSLFGAVFVAPVMVLYLQSHDLNLFEITSIQTCFAFGMAILELPTGYLADRLGRRRTLIISSLFMSVAAFKYLHSDSYWGFVVAELLFAGGISFYSGSCAAWLYDYLVQHSRESEYSRINGRGTSLFMLTLAASSILGARLASYSMVYPYYAMFLSFSLMIPVSLMIKEPERAEYEYQSPLEDAREIYHRYVRQDAMLVWIGVFSAFLMIGTQVAFWLYQPLFQVSGVSIEYFGWIFASFNVVAAICSSQVEWLEKRLSRDGVFLLMAVLILLGFALMGWVNSSYCFLFAYTQQIVRGLFRTMLSEVIHRRVKSNFRASVLSLHSLIGCLSQGLAVLLAGHLADSFGVHAAYKAFFGILILMLLVLYRFHPERVRSSRVRSSRVSALSGV